MRKEVNSGKEWIWKSLRRKWLRTVERTQLIKLRPTDGPMRHGLGRLAEEADSKRA